MDSDKELDLFSNKLIEKKREASEDKFIATEDITQDIINLLLAGKSRSEIRNAIPYDATTIGNFIDKAEAEIASIAAVDVDSIIATHVSIYEKLFNLASEKGYTGGKLRSMKQKEDLLVLSNDVNEIRIINESEAIIQNKDDYDFTQLEDEDRNRLIKLLEKVK